MKPAKRRIAKSVILAVGLALALLSVNGPPAALAQASDLKLEEICTPAVFRPNEWFVQECVTKVTNTGDQPLRNISTSLTADSGAPLEGYFMLFEVDGNPLPIDPAGPSFAAGGELAPGVTAEVRIVALLRMPEEGIHEETWTTTVNGEIVPATPDRYEARDDAASPPTDLSVRQIGISRGRQAVFTTTVTNNSSSPVTQLSLWEHYGPDGVEPAGFSPSEWESYPGATYLAKWGLSAFGIDALGPGETLTLVTAYDGHGSPFVQSGVLVEATVDGQQQLYGSSAGNIYVGRNDQGAQSPVAQVPSTGEGPSSRSLPFVTLAALVVTGVSLIGSAQLLRKSLRR